MLRNLLLWASENAWMKNRIPKMYFTRKAVKHFMPGEALRDAIKAALQSKEQGLETVFTYLGENIGSLAESDIVTEHYILALKEITNHQLPTEISLKLTQLGLDYSFNKAMHNFLFINRIAQQHGIPVWIDMEGSDYVEKTLDFFELCRDENPNIGLCVQSYLYRTQSDLERIYRKPAHIRLVKGAYRESDDIAFPKKSQVDENYLKLAQLMLEKSAEIGGKVVFGTHDLPLLSRIESEAETRKLSGNGYEIHMLYGIRSLDQMRLKEEGRSVKVLISYGDAWYPWYMRRLAERPANLFFVFKNVFRR